MRYMENNKGQAILEYILAVLVVSFSLVGTYKIFQTALARYYERISFVVCSFIP